MQIFAGPGKVGLVLVVWSIDQADFMALLPQLANCRPSGPQLIKAGKKGALVAPLVQALGHVQVNGLIGQVAESKGHRLFSSWHVLQEVSLPALILLFQLGDLRP